MIAWVAVRGRRTLRFQASEAGAAYVEALRRFGWTVRPANGEGTTVDLIIREGMPR